MRQTIAAGDDLPQAQRDQQQPRRYLEQGGAWSRSAGRPGHKTLHGFCLLAGLADDCGDLGAVPSGVSLAVQVSVVARHGKVSTDRLPE